MCKLALYDGINECCSSNDMGEAKRRQEVLGEDYGKPESFLKGLPISKDTASKFVTWSTIGAWGGIVLMIVTWLTIRFIGPGFGWWTLAN